MSLIFVATVLFCFYAQHYHRAMNRYESWGRYPKVSQHVHPLAWQNDTLEYNNDETILPFGLGRSYGDVCLNNGGAVISTRTLNHFLSFDHERGVIICEAGVSLDEILQLIVPHGWFIPVSPGTKYVTVGGAIANDIHGKNHHRAGTFGCHVRQFELLRSNGERLLCSLSSNPELFSATIGGLGLTGIILWAEISLKKIENAFIDVETIKFSRLEEFFEISRNSDKDFEYTVAWIDSLAHGNSLGRGLFMRGNHAASSLTSSHKVHQAPLLTIPLDAPDFLLNNFTIKLFNNLYYNKQVNKYSREVVHYDPFFYPLDVVGEWNRMYGPRGFFQYQCVVPPAEQEVIREILKLSAASGEASFLSVLKEFGSVRSPGMLSFPREGITLTLDFANNGARTLALMERFDEFVLRAGGSVYPAKDARMAADSFKKFFPLWKKFSEYIDPKFSSSFWRRVTQ